MSDLAGSWVLDTSRQSGGSLSNNSVTYQLEARSGSVNIEVLDVGASTVKSKYSFNFVWAVSSGPYAGITIPDYGDESMDITANRFGDVILYNEGTYSLKATVIDENLVYVEESDSDTYYDPSFGTLGPVSLSYYLKRGGSSPNPPSGDPSTPTYPTYPTHPGSTSVSGSEQEFVSANQEMEGCGVEVLPGNQQAQMDSSIADSNGWYVLTNLDNASIFVEKANSDILPDCFTASGKCAADVTIPALSSVPSGRQALLPMTYSVTLSEQDLTDLIGSSYASMALSNPAAYLEDIFYILVIQKEIKQGGWEGYFTRLVDGVLTPEEAYGRGILKVTGGQALTIELSYYLLDGPEGTGSRKEAFLEDGYLIVPDGHYDGVLRDQIWLSVWKDTGVSLETTEAAGIGSNPSPVPGSTSNPSSGSSSKGGGGGCDSGFGAAALLAAALAGRKRPQGPPSHL
jgi:hypothetical protein